MEQFLAIPPDTGNQAFLREVDEEYRREQLQHFWRRWGLWLVAGVVAVLIGVGIWFFILHSNQQAAERHGEQYAAALTAISNSELDKANRELASLRESDKGSYGALARMAEALLLLNRDKTAQAAAKFGEIANDDNLPLPMRQLALVRQTLAEYDRLQPAQVIQRLGAIAVPGNPYFGTAGEMVAAAYMKQGKTREAAALYSRIGQTETVPESLRQRATQMAATLGAAPATPARATGATPTPTNSPSATAGQDEEGNHQ